MPSNIQLNDHVNSLSISVERLTAKLENIPSDEKMQNLVDPVVKLTNKLEQFTISQNTTLPIYQYKMILQH